MNLASSIERAEATLFADGLGERVIAADGTTGELLQILRLRPALTAVPSFEFALRERTARLVNFRHAYYARVRRIDRIQAGGSLAIVSDHVEGTRLSEILRITQARGLQLDTNAALCLIRQLVPAVALLHENARDASHGAIAPERIVVTPHARLVIVEHVAGSAIEQLQFPRERLWQEFRIAMPSSAGMSRFDHRADVNGIGMTALSLVLGRPLAADEFPHAIPSLLMQARERSPYGEERPLSNGFRNWLARTMQLDVRRAFASAPEALAALEETLATDSAYIAAPVALETFLSQYMAAMLEPTASAVALAPVTGPTAVVPAARSGESNQPGAALPFDSRTPQSTSGSAEDRDEELPTLADLISVSDLQSGVDRLDESGGSRHGHDDLVGLGLPIDAQEDQTNGSAVAAPATKNKRSRVRLVVGILALLLIAGAAVVGARLYRREAAPALGTLIVQSSPAGIEVFVDGVTRGMTPARLSLDPGSHILELRGRGVPRVIPFQLAAGAQVSQYLEFADTPDTGLLVVHSQPAGAKVTIDGVPRGEAPITLERMTPGDHEVVLQSDAGSSKHVVKVLAGTTASLVAPVVPTTPEGPVSGWISIKAPVTIEIHEGGQLVGTTDSDRLMMAAGRHTLDFTSKTLGYRESRVVQVTPGKTTSLAIQLPKGTVNLNATPWAEVWIDGTRVGETPLGNLEVPIGPHEIVFRHPQFGERRHAVSVTAGAPVRLSVPMK